MTALKSFYLYKEKQPLIFSRLAPHDLQDQIRFFELSSSTQYGLCAIEGVYDAQTYDAYCAKNPIARHLNLVKWASGMEQIPMRRVWLFNEDLRFESSQALYSF